MSEPAQREGDARRTAPDQGDLDQPQRAERRLAVPVPDGVRRAAHAEWLRRRRLERQLHDGAALRISALALQIGVLRHRVPAEVQLNPAIDALQDELHAILQELREVSGEIYPPLLDQAGLGPALREVADRIPAPTRVHAGPERFGVAAEGAAHFAITECLDALDPDTPEVDIYLRRELSGCGGPLLVVEIEGVDAWHAAPMLERVRPLGATMEITQGTGAATITVRIPCE